MRDPPQLEDEARGNGAELRPERALWRWEDVEPRGDGHGGRGRLGSGGTGLRPKKRCQKFQERASSTPGGAERSASTKARSPKRSRAKGRDFDRLVRKELDLNWDGRVDPARPSI